MCCDIKPINFIKIIINLSFRSISSRQKDASFTLFLISIQNN